MLNISHSQVAKPTKDDRETYLFLKLQVHQRIFVMLHGAHSFIDDYRSVGIIHANVKQTTGLLKKQVSGELWIQFRRANLPTFRRHRWRTASM